MWNTPIAERLSKIPRLYETEHIPLQDKLIYLHFFIGGCDWYIAEYDGEDLFWGFAILNDEFQNAEWGWKLIVSLRSSGVCEKPVRSKRSGKPTDGKRPMTNPPK